jgi:lysophospholipase L1-like esterase
LRATLPLLIGVSLACVAAHRARGAAYEVVFTGDSNTEGLIDGRIRPELSFVNLVSERMGLEESIINRGRSGASTDDGIQRFPTDVASVAPDVVFIAFGVNDFRLSPEGSPFVPLDRFGSNLAWMVGSALAIGTYVVLLTPSPVDEEMWRSTFPDEDYAPWGGVRQLRDRYAGAVLQVAQRFSVPVIDILPLFGDSLPQFVGSDGVHFSAAGHRKIAGAVYDLLLAHPHSVAPEDPAPAGVLRASPDPVVRSRDVRLVLSYALDRDARVSLTIYSMAGTPVRCCATDAGRPRGRLFETWDLEDDDARPVPAGIYLAKLRVRYEDGRTATAKAKIVAIP